MMGNSFIAYIEDILIYSPVLESHESRGCWPNYYSTNFMRKECEFPMSQISFLGYTISKKGVIMGKIKVNTVEWPICNAIKDLQRFLGFVKFTGGSFGASTPLPLHSVPY